MSDSLREALAALTLREPDTPNLWEQSNNVELTGGEKIAYEWGVTDTLSDVRHLLAAHPTDAAQRCDAPGCMADQMIDEIQDYLGVKGVEPLPEIKRRLAANAAQRREDMTNGFMAGWTFGQPAVIRFDEKWRDVARCEAKKRADILLEAEADRRFVEEEK